MATKKQRHAKILRKSLRKDLPEVFRNEQPRKQSLARSCSYTGGRTCQVIQPDGTVKRVGINATGAPMPKYGRRETGSKFDTANRKANKAITDTVMVADSLRQDSQSQSNVKSLVSAVTAIKQSAGLPIRTR